MARKETLLSMIQAVAGELNLTTPQSVIGNQTQDVIQIFVLFKRALKEIIRVFEWEALQTQYIIYTQFLDTTGDTTAGSPVVQNVNVANAPASFFSNPYYYYVRGAYTPTQDTRVLAVDQTDPFNVRVTLNQNATETSTAASILFAQQVYDLPADYEAMVNRTHWDSSKRWEMLGPESPQQFNWLKEGYISTGPRIRWRLQNNQFNTWPYFGTNERLSFEYRSNSAIVAADGVTPKVDFTDDNDLITLDEMVVILRCKLKYFQIKGFATEDLERDYNRILSITKANDRGAAILSFSPRPSEVLIGYQNIPDAGFGS